MDVFEAIETRRSIRKYEKRPVEQGKLLKILEAGRLSPSAKNLQPLAFVAVTDPGLLGKLDSATNQRWEAPAMLVGCAMPGNAWVRDDGEEYWKVDAAIAMQSMCLAAWEEGIGTCWICAFREGQVKEILGIPSDVRVVALMALGYPRDKKGPVEKRKPLDEIVHYDRW